MKYYTIKRSFTSGEVSPLVKMRGDLKHYPSGCLSLYNMIIIPQGPTTRRMGLIFRGDLTVYTSAKGMSDLTESRMIPFIFSEDESYGLIFVTDSTITRVYFVYNDGLIEDPADPGYPYYITIDAAYNFDVTNFDYAQQKDYVFLAYSANLTLNLIRTGHTSWSISPVAFTTGYPADWNSTDGYPEKISFYQQRMILAANGSYPQRLWLSESGDIVNFVAPSPLVATSTIDMTLASGKHNRIQWILGARQLFSGTLGDEFVISGGNDPLTYETVRADSHSNQGSEAIKPIQVGSSLLFVEHLGRVVSQLTYDYQTDSYVPTDVSVLSPHLLYDYYIKYWDYQKVPNSIIWAITSDGNLLGLTHQSQHGVVGWHRHETDGSFKSLCCIPLKTQRHTATWFLVEREVEVSGSVETHLMLEKFAIEFLYQQDDTDFMYLDSATLFENPGTETLTGLDHLEGCEVGIIADGGYHAPQTVVNGEITLYKVYDKVWVGRQYYSEIIPTEPQLDLSDGPSEGRVKKLVTVYINLYRSIGFKYGTDENKLFEEPFRRVTDPTGVGVPPFTGTKKVDIPSGYTRDPVIIIRQEKPMPLTVLGLTEVVQVSEKD